MNHPSLTQFESTLAEIRQSPKDHGTLEMIVRRPGVEQREVLDSGELDVAEGLVGDNWRIRGSARTADGSSHPEMQLTLINTRLIARVAGEESRWPLAGDQLYVDLDLSAGNLPPGTRLEIGCAVIEITALPHTGCKKFVKRFGRDALRFVSSPVGRELCLRGVHARVVHPGGIRVGDVVRKFC